MSKVSLVAQREFLTRVRKKTFLLTTILLPLLFFGFYALIIYFSVSTDEKFNIAVNDDANIFKGKIDGDANVHFSFVQHQTAQQLKTAVEKGTYDGYAIIPANTNILGTVSIPIITENSVGIMSR